MRHYMKYEFFPARWPRVWQRAIRVNNMTLTHGVVLFGRWFVGLERVVRRNRPEVTLLLIAFEHTAPLDWRETQKGSSNA